jgi:endonuclease III
MNYEKVFKVFKKYYNGIPLEVFNDPYRGLISTVMSARTNDNVTLIEANKLFEKAPNFESLNTLTEEEIYNLIKKVGFAKTKAKHIKELTYRILKEFKGSVPKSREALMKLPGVGIKTANLVLNRSFGVAAISVDTHVHHITNLLGWVKTKTPEKTLIELEKTLPKKYWSDINKLFVSMGRQFTSRKKLVEFLEKEKLL